MLENDFSIILDGRYLSVRGMRSDILERRAYHQMEIRFGEFVSEVELPYQILASEIEAVYSNGFLQIRLPKARPVRISVEE
jgi:HSP20 family protein